ncbi:N-acetylglucosaminyltransferase [Actibacterium mucosum KCTC 23349]|uniref:N-acetylglucosaminyltransferase n=1 Tax=Actibacterium mucosum KCTC 23349 TaxID=1454373 RepID=A0A037ZER3_9RHOB|nr:glycosyltransferase family 2 protein [Actibacterium mucosum]KAJ54945.1 N-acetylglucosaminyltransferase [Actibacterium mucosum KCTC 23349]
MPEPVARPFLEPVFSTAQKVKYRIAVGVAVLASLYFWSWWFQAEHVIGWGRFILVSMVLGWTNFLVFYFFAFFLRSKRPAGWIRPHEGVRVAMIVTKTPSEPLSLLKTTLTAMLSQDVPHDTWLADEDPTPDTIAWCEAHGVYISSRKGCEEYHQKTWPRRTRCKEGNLAYFYDHYGYENYDFVSQLDADHVPQPGYLREIMKGFADPRVGYVSAPSICDANAQYSWAARTRLYTEALFHGAFQGGLSDGWAPMCIGSHYAVRTKALRDVGGLGPDLAEDHSTTMIMNAGGWRGVHAIDAIAHGAGPESISDLATQEFQWSRSLVTLLLSHTPRYLRNLPPRLRFQFLFCQLLYPFSALTHLAMFLMPVLAVAFDIRFANVTYPAFIGHAIPAAAILTWIVLQARKDGLMRPLNAKIFSWDKILFLFLQWPWVLLGCLVALRDRLTGSFVDFRITPKGQTSQPPLPTRILTPYFLLSAMSALPVLMVDNLTKAGGFYVLSLLYAGIYAGAFASILIRHLRENAVDWQRYVPRLSTQFAASVFLIALVGASFWARGTHGLHALTVGLGPYQVTEMRFYVSGAGQSQGRVHYQFRKDILDWPKSLLERENAS